MKYKLISHNKIKIGLRNIIFPEYTIIDKIETLSSVVCFKTTPLENDLDWNDLETHQIWRDRCSTNPRQLLCYDFSGKLKWKLPYDNVVGFGQIFPNLKEVGDFITPKHFANYIEKYNHKELLEVYTGNLRLIVDANTGEIYDEIESH